MKQFAKREITPQQIIDAFGSEGAQALDGVWIGACSTTRIYCRTVCPAGVHVDNANVRAFSSAAAAEGAGFRPCLTCCPECAPAPSEEAGFAPEAVVFAAAVEQGIANPSDEGLAAEALTAAGLSAQEGEAMTQAQFGTSVAHYVATARRLAAKRLMRQAVISLDEVAAACGFDSAQAVADQFAQHYKLDAFKLAAQRPRKPSIMRLDMK